MSREEDLIKLALAKPLPTEDQDDSLNEAERFCIATKLEQGRWIIRAPYIYQMYCSWAVNPINKDAFFKQFAKLFLPLTKHNRRIYKLNKSFYELGEIVKKLKRQT